MRRLFGCSGTIQLITAWLAGMTCAGGRQQQITQDYLLCYRVGRGYGHDPELMGVLARMAEQLGHWTRIDYLTEAQIDDLWQHARAHGWRSAAKLLKARLGIDEIDELYLGQNRWFHSSLLKKAYAPCRMVCYGDGIGINFSSEYLNPEAYRAAAEAALDPPPAESVCRLRRSGMFISEIAFDEYCLLLPDLFDEKVHHNLSPNADDCRRLFSSTANLLAGRSCALTELQTALAEASQVLVVLTADWSGLGQLDPASEVCAYVDFLKAMNPESLVVLKPHPREPEARSQSIRRALEQSFRTVITLGDPLAHYLPFECIYAAFLEQCRQVIPVQIASFGTNCLALEFLYNQRCHLGFGDELVRKYFYPSHVEYRLNQESNIRRAVKLIGERLSSANEEPASKFSMDLEQCLRQNE